MEENVAMRGNRLDVVKDIISKEDCCNICKDWEGCSFFTYRVNKKTCWLKDSDQGRTQDNKAVSGSVNCCKGKILTNV